MRHLRSVLVLASVALLSAFFMASAYRRARNDAIEQLYAQERILAEQATKGITEYFAYCRQLLEFLARSDDVAASTPAGERLLRDLFQAQGDNLLSLTRVGPDGRILYSYPEERAAGRNILDQAHVRAVFETRRPVVSQVFKSVQGFETVAMHVPVWREGRFAGSLAALVPFDAISKRHVAGIRIGQSGFAALLSREGIELFCEFPGHTGRSIFSTSQGFPGALEMARRMVAGETGRHTYTYAQVNGGATHLVTKHAYFTRIPLEDSFWSIVVTAEESEALVFIQGLRNRLAFGLGALLVAFATWGVVLARAYVRLDREETQKAAQARVLEAERERERTLRVSEERFRTYFEHSLLAMAMTSPAKRWLHVNDRLTQLLGYTREELDGLTWEQITHPDDVAADLRQFHRMMAGEIDGYSLEKRYVRKDGGLVYIILSVRLVRTADGAPDYCLTQMQDITDRRLLDEERGRLGEQLRQAQKLEAIGQLAGGVAHDYNNLLTVQLGHLGLLHDEPGLSPEVTESLTAIEQSATMAAQLTRQLLAFGRRQVLQIERIDLNEIVESLSKMLRRVLRENITVDLALAPAPLWLDADAGMVEQVIMNMVVNARDAMPDGGRLTLATSAAVFTDATVPGHADAQPGAFVCLSIADTGEGMSDETRQRIFEPFFTTKDAGKGTGLGLATAYGIVRQHRGWIDVESAVGRGTVFRVYLEAAAATAPEAQDERLDDEAPLHEGHGELILTAEDNPAVRHMLTTSLERMRYRVLSASDALEAQDLWEAHRDDVRLLLTDMVMGGNASGLELARRLRRDRPELPVIVMSGYSEELVGRNLGTDTVFLAKPWTPESLARVVQRCLGSQPS
jgi:PAS domain S-box-containing protein